MTNSETGLTGLMPPEDVLAAEFAILGAAIQSQRAAERMLEIVKPADFWRSKHQIIAESIDGLIGDGRPVSPVGVLNDLRARGRLSDNLGGTDLHAMAANYSTTLDRDAGLVAKDGERRRILLELSSALNVASKPGFDAETDMDDIRRRLDAAVSSEAGDDAQTVGELLVPYLEEIERPLTDEDRVPAPYADLTAAIGGGFRPGQFIIIGARPSVGKSLAALDTARYASIKSDSHLPVLFISLEMSKKEVMDRLLAAESGVLLKKFTEHNLDDDDRRQIARIQDRIFAGPITVDDRPHCTVGRIRARLRKMARTSPCRMLIIDYLTLMEVPHAESRERQVAELSRSLKLLAKEFEIPVIALHQLNRESTRRPDKLPATHDLRESGMIEADADIIMLLHRDDLHEPESPRAGELDIRLDKNRNGPCGVITVCFQGHRGRLVDMVTQPPSLDGPRDYSEPPPRGPYLSAVPD
jgi:replicative DNA helicase